MNIGSKRAGWLAACSTGSVGLLLVLAVATAPISACGHGGTEPTSVCDNVYAAISGAISGTSIEMVIVGCHQSGGQAEQQLTNISYNNDGTVRSFDFDVRCTTTGEHYTGSVYTIRYQGGVPVGYSLKVDSQDCGPQ